MFWIFANDHDTALALDDLTFVTHLFDGRSDFHFCASFAHLLEAIGNSAVVQIIGSQFQGNPVPRQYPNEIHSHLAGNVCQDYVSIFQFDPKHGIGKFFNYFTFHFNDIFLTHGSLLLAFDVQSMVSVLLSTTAVLICWTCGLLSPTAAVHLYVVAILLLCPAVMDTTLPSCIGNALFMTSASGFQARFP